MDEMRLTSSPPREEDRLLRDGFPDWHNNACLNFSPNGNEHGYPEGYKIGAGLLVEFVERNQTDQDFLVYPIIFLYRHHIELVLKKMLRSIPPVLGRLLTDVEAKRLSTKHNLSILWNDVRPLLPLIAAEGGWAILDEIDLKGIDTYIGQLTDFDPDSSAFRYASNKSGEPSIASNVQRINLRNFSERLEQLSSYLSALGTAVDYLEQQQSSMESAWG